MLDATKWSLFYIFGINVKIHIYTLCTIQCKPFHKDTLLIISTSHDYMVVVY